LRRKFGIFSGFVDQPIGCARLISRNKDPNVGKIGFGEF
jgi:hypothetical protein